ncbi:MAG: hypothetical protein A2Y40_10610 [Candidatus Margulisbacteria bacterium GWF2_35_9]|nr:MAG: hypothetical protein A2Y40_10610 [Candidatus Margulisbacteria bacterium GWF2_35_9]
MIQIILSYLTIYVVWSTTAFIIKTAVQGIPAFYLFGMRFLIGGAILLLIAVVTRKKRQMPSISQFAGSLFIGLLLLIGGNGLITFALQKLDSYVTALVISTIPICVLVFDRLILKTHITLHAIIGVSMGISGVLILILNSGRGNVSIHPYIFIVVVAVIIWALGMSLGKKIPMSQDTIINSGIQQFSMGLISLIMIQPFQPVGSVAWGDVTNNQWMALIYLTVFGTIAITCFLYLLRIEPNERVVTYNFITPLGSAFIGIVIGGEAIIPGLVPSAFLILAGLAVTFYGEKIFNKTRFFNRNPNNR